VIPHVLFEGHARPSSQMEVKFDWLHVVVVHGVTFITDLHAPNSGAWAQTRWRVGQKVWQAEPAAHVSPSQRERQRFLPPSSPQTSLFPHGWVSLQAREQTPSVQLKPALVWHWLAALHGAPEVPGPPPPASITGDVGPEHAARSNAIENRNVRTRQTMTGSAHG